MNHRDHDVRIRGSLERCVGDAPISEADLLRKAAAVYAEGRGVYFTPAQLKEMPAMVRATIEGEARRIYG